MISRHLQQYVDNNCVGGAQMDVLLEDGVDGAKRAVIRLSEMDDDKEDVNIRLRRHDDNTADCLFGSGGMADESQVFHDAAEKVVEWMMGWSNLDVRIFNRLTSDFLLRGSFKMVDRARQSRNQELRLRRLAQNAPETLAAAPSHAAPAAVAQKRGESVHESAAVPSTARDPPATSKPVATGDMPPPRPRGRGKGGDGGEDLDVFEMTPGNLEGGGPIFEAGRQGGANLQGEGAIAVGEPVSEGVGGSDGDTAKMTRFKEQADAYKLRTLAKRVVAEYVQAERATHAAILYSISLDQHARSSDVEVASTWTAAVDEHQKGLSEALATYKGKALKGKGKGKEVEVADAPVSLLEKWEKSPVSQDDDDILDVNDEIAKGKRLRKQLAVQPRDLDEMSKALVHRNRVWTRNLFVGPQKLLARDLHLSRAEQNATIFANSESDYGHDKLVIPVWRYSFQFLADRCPNTFHDWMKKEGTQRQLAQLFGEMGGARTMKAGYARAMTDKEIDIYLRTSSAKGMAEAASTAVLTGRPIFWTILSPWT
eukprot:jgi/Mesvir1/15927/Mv08250-RA.1